MGLHPPCPQDVGAGIWELGAPGSGRCCWDHTAQGPELLPPGFGQQESAQLHLRMDGYELKPGQSCLERQHIGFFSAEVVILNEILNLGRVSKI